MVLGIFKAKSLAPILPLVLCSCLLCESPTELQKAHSLLARGSLSQAVTVLRRVLQTDPNNADAHLTLGTAFALQGLRVQSINEIETAIKLSPNSASAHNQLGVVFSRFLQSDAARKAFEDALSLEPNYADAHVNLALVLAQTGELPLAHEHLDQAIALYGSAGPAAKAYFMRAKVWSAQGDNNSAILDLEEATQLNPDYADAWFDLSQLQHSKDDSSGAFATAKNAANLDRKNASMQSWLGQLYLENGDVTCALHYLQIASTLGDEDKATLYSLARALRATGKVQQAKQVDEKVIEMQRLSNRAGNVLFTASGFNDEGLKLEEKGDLIGALEKYHKAVDLDPTGYGFRLNYALALCRIGKWQDGIVQLQEVLKQDPNNADAAKALFIAQEELKHKTN